MSRGEPRLPPTNLHERPLNLTTVRGRYWRCAQEGRPLVDWDERITSRFSRPGMPVLYLSAHWQTAFHEVYGDNLLDMLPEDRAIALSDLQSRRWVEFDLSEKLHAFDLTKSARQREIGADGTTFRYSYKVTQPWAAALRKNPKVEALEYASRLDDPRLCLAVFGTKKFLAKGETLFTPRAGKRLSEDSDFLFWLLHSEKITVKV